MYIIALSRQPLPLCTVTTKDYGSWYKNILVGVQANQRNFPEYCIKDGSLFRHILHTLDFNEYSENEAWKLCVPAGERIRVLREAHDDPTAGHLGIAKTLSRLARYYYWPGMLREGASHVRNCLNPLTPERKFWDTRRKKHILGYIDRWKPYSIGEMSCSFEFRY